MSTEQEKQPKSILGSLLGESPPDPTILQAMVDARATNHHYSAIGQVAASYAYFEANVDEWIWVLMDIHDDVGVCLTGQMIGPRPR